MWHGVYTKHTNENMTNVVDMPKWILLLWNPKLRKRTLITMKVWSQIGKTIYELEDSPVANRQLQQQQETEALKQV